MLRFSLFGFPILVDWWFWIACILLGGGMGANDPDEWTEVGIWTAVVFVSIMVHELGHAVAGRRFGASPTIKLHAFGGLTFLHEAKFTRGQSIIVSAAGPAAGFILGLAVLAIAKLLPEQDTLLDLAISSALYVNFFWTAVNLLPIQPLDGGQILRESLGPRRVGVTAGIGFVLAAGLCVWAFSEKNYFLAIMLGLLAYYNFSRAPIEGGVIKR